MSSNIAKKFRNKQALDRIKKRDKDAFTKAYDKNIDDIYRFVFFKVGSKEEAQDITSAIFLKTWNHIQNNTLESAKTLRALLYKVARSTIIDHYRQQGKGLVLSIDDSEEAINIKVEEDEDGRIDMEKNISIIRSKLPLLKEEYKEIIILRFINELEIDEISDITGKSRGNIRVLLHRALRALRGLLDEDEKKEGKESLSGE